MSKCHWSTSLYTFLTHSDFATRDDLDFELQRPRLEASSIADAVGGEERYQEDLAAPSFFAHSPTHEVIRGAMEAMRSRFSDANRREEGRTEGRGVLRFRVLQEAQMMQRVRESIFQDIELCGMGM